jgi:hypothetical protein
MWRHSEVAMDKNGLVGTVPAGITSLTDLTFMHLEVNCLAIDSPELLLSALTANAPTG